MAVSYENFEVWIGPAEKGPGYRAIARCRAGQGATGFEPPAKLMELFRSTFPSRELWEVRAFDFDPDSLRRAREVGDQLFQELFSGDVRSLYDRSLGAVPDPRRGLRIVLHLPPELFDLPWELLCSTSTNHFDFLSLNRLTPVTRYIDLLRPAAVPVFEPPLRILLAAATSGTKGALDLPREIRLIQRELRGAAEIEVLERTSLENLREAMLRDFFHILHFMGHGDFDPITGRGILLLESEAGREDRVSGEMLALHLKDRLPYLAVVNACNSGRALSRAGQDFFAGVASALVQGGLPAVIAMRSPISDPAAIAFSKALYHELAADEPVDAAVTEGRLAIYRTLPTSLEWATPVLFMRLPDGHLFPRQRPDAASPAREVASQNQGAAVPGEPSSGPIVRWHDLPPLKALNVFRLLDWRSRLTPLVGRDEDLRDLVQWVHTEDEVLVRFLVGPGGSGKSRLALEAADILRGDGWEAGQVFLDRPYPPLAAEKGLFWVIDYPEASRQQVEDLLRNLARMEQTPVPIRVLLLSRRVMREWHPVIDAADAAAICDAQEVRLGPLAVPKAVELFHAATRRFAEYLGHPVPAFSDTAVADWLDRDRESNPLPLFIIAAALHCTLTGGDELSLSGSQIVEALVRRERMRLEKIGRRTNWGEGVVPRLIGLATVSGGLEAETLRRLAAERELGLPADRTVDAVKSLGFWDGHRVPAPSPDIIAAELLFEILDDRPDQAASWLWACLIDTAAQNVDRLGRIAYDIARLRGPGDFNRFTAWLAGAIDGQPARADKWRRIYEEDRLPLGVLPLAVAIGKALLKGQIVAESERANVLTLLSNRLNDIGDAAGALEASREAVEIYRRLAAENPQHYEPELARSLRSLAICLRSEKDTAGALEAGREAVEIWRRLAAVNPVQYEPDLARSLRVLSICLSEHEDENRTSAALEVIREAVEIWRRLAAADSMRFEPDLAQSLNTLAVDLSEVEDREGALAVMRQAVEIWQRLASANPARYEPDLALGLNNLSRELQMTGDSAGAVEAIHTAIRIYGRVVAANPARYEPDLARSIDNLYRDLSDTEDPKAALNAVHESVEIQRKLVAAYPTRYEPGLAQRLDRLSHDLSDPGNAVEVLEAIRAARHTVMILLIRGESPQGAPIYAYVAVRGDKLEALMDAQKKGMFYPEDFGVIVESGEGEPSPEVRAKMETEYGFNHEGMLTIPDSEVAYNIVKSLKPSPEEEEEEHP